MQVDQILKDFWEDNDRFADFFNTVFFKGEKVIFPEELETISTDVSTVEETKQGLESQMKYRDKVKRWKGVKLAVLGIENQDRIHYAMPERTLLYEALQYEAQRKETAARHKKNRDLKESNEYLSGFAKEDRLNPVLTVVIYYGEKPWDGPTSLEEMVDIPEELRAFFQDYQMNLFQVFGNDGRDFKNEDIRTVFRNANALRSGRIQDLDEKIDTELVKYVAAFVNSERVMKLSGKRKKEDVQMCTALEELIKQRENEGKAEGKAEDVLELLEDLEPVPEELRERIMKEKNLETLRKWVKQAARADSVESFIRVIEKAEE